MPKVPTTGGGFIVKMLKDFFRTPRTSARAGSGPEAPALKTPALKTPAPKTPAPKTSGSGPAHPNPFAHAPDSPQARPLAGAEPPEVAVRNANPHFDPKDPTGPYNVNCTNCVVAVEHRMRGWDVQARPFTGGPAGRFGDPSEGWRGPDGRPVEHHVYHENVGDEFPDGASGSIYGGWRMGGGHIWNWRKQDGVMQYFDGQTGLADASGYFDNLAPGTTALYRTDDADWIGDPSDWIMPS
ncbi:toxin glutamine deamidase domain-containing protein [Propioniferax innocua]|uniref:Papain fold toxin 1 (Glutamine deamidase) of polymorphic toxin system n=1 Tax=Propioniferax innocua TaxID=1753 RepID=A0A542ZR14_9ACTN|nr:toxin glutamine deamidase domain-containing protein [Propioniferax innocua]TQL62767.1 papain fold toxin 1 (glutamine deamidase) of polymorphic toxin system [Propioniferax innocua]